MISVFEYNKLKDTKYNLIQNIKYSEAGPEKVAELKKQLKQVEDDIVAAEKEETIIKYNDLIKRRIRLQQTIGSWKYYKKDTTKLEENLNLLIQEISAMELDHAATSKPAISQQKTTTLNTRNVDEMFKVILEKMGNSTPSTQVTAGSEPTYYIINLAWSRTGTDESANCIIEAVKDYLNMTNYTEASSDFSDERGERMITWKYNYDTIEEQANVKALKMAAVHLLDILKTQWNPGLTDAELFGKVQKY